MPGVRQVALATAIVLNASCQQDTTAPTQALDAPSGAAAALAGTWTRRAAYPRASLYDAASASVTNSSTLRTVMYVIGGTPDGSGGPGLYKNMVMAYDVTANTWSA